MLRALFLRYRLDGRHEMAAFLQDEECAIGVRRGSTVNLYSMEGRGFNERFPDVVSALKKLSVDDLVLDGELVAVEPSGRPNFNELQNAASTKLPIYYVVFDVLHYESRDLFDVPLEQRKAACVRTRFRLPNAQVQRLLFR
jgi:ATP dependent DNA ligase domain